MSDPASPPRRKRRFLRWLMIIALAAVFLFAFYTWLSLTWSYSHGERAGYVQKFSHRGWLFNTWEGELAIVSMPGTTPEKFFFSVRNDSVAARITRTLGERVVLVYEQHIGVPLDWWGDTEYFVSDVRVIEPAGRP